MRTENDPQHETGCMTHISPSIESLQPVSAQESQWKDVRDQSTRNGESLSMIPQFDGNATLLSSESDRDQASPSVTNPSEKENKDKHSKDQEQETTTLPTIAVANLRSLKPRINSVAEKMRNEDIEVLMINEVWEPENNRSFQMQLQKVYEMKGLKITTCGSRPNGKRGGGAGVVVDCKRFSMEDLKIKVPKNLEVKWVLLRPKKLKKETKFKEIIICSFYNPPKSKKQKFLVEHITTTTHLLQSKYPNAAMAIGGDKNELNIESLRTTLPTFKQVVRQPTYKTKILDILLLNNSKHYDAPEVSREVLPDNPVTHKPSDHRVPVVRPAKGTPKGQRNVYKEVKYRPLPESAVRGFVSGMLKQEWDFVKDKSPTEQVNLVHDLLGAKVEDFFPEKIVKLSSEDKPFITKELKSLDRKRKREWKKNGKSERYKLLNKEFKEKFKKASSEFLKKNVSELKHSNPGKAARTLKRFAANPCDTEEDNFITLSSHSEDNLSDEQQLERIANYFVSIASEF